MGCMLGQGLMSLRPAPHPPTSLNSSFLHPQGQALSLELGISDASGTRRRVLLSSSFADIKATPLHCQVPILPLVRDGWLNLVMALGEMVPLLFKVERGILSAPRCVGCHLLTLTLSQGATFRQLDAIAISAGGCKLRRVFTLREASDEVRLIRGVGRWIHCEAFLVNRAAYLVIPFGILYFLPPSLPAVSPIWI